MTTIHTVYASNQDAFILSTGASYAIARAGTGTKSVNQTLSTQETGQRTASNAVRQTFYDFNTSSIPSGLAAAANLLNLYIHSASASRQYIAAEPGDLGATIITADFVPGDDLSALQQGAAQGIASAQVGSYYEFPVTSIVTRHANYWVIVFAKDQMDNVAPTASAEVFTARTANYTGTASDPFLTIELQGPPEGELAVTLDNITPTATARAAMPATVDITIGDIIIAASSRAATPGSLLATLDAIGMAAAATATVDPTTPLARSISFAVTQSAQRSLIMPRGS